MKSAFRYFLIGSVLLAGMASQGSAAGISGSAGVSGLGAWDGSLDYVAGSSTNATLTIAVNNVTPSELGGFLTGFAFNNPSDAITDVSLTSGNANFGVLGGLIYQNGVAASPHGNFDVAVSTGSTFDGDGDPANGIAPGGSQTFEFALTGNGLDTLSAESFVTALSDTTGGGLAKSMVARFRGFANDGTDTVPFGSAIVDDPPVVDPPEVIEDTPPVVIVNNPPPGGTLATPEPTSLTLAGIAISCLFTHSRARRRRHGGAPSA